MTRTYRQLPREWQEYARSHAGQVERFRPFKPEPEERECVKCGFRGKVDQIICRCGKRLYTESNIRMRGLGLIAVGVLLSAFMAAISIGLFVLLAGVTDKEAVRRINDSVWLLIGIYGLFAAVIAFGANSVVMGFWQVLTGRRNKVLMWVGSAIFYLMAIGGYGLRAFTE